MQEIRFIKGDDVESTNYTLSNTDGKVIDIIPVYSKDIDIDYSYGAYVVIEYGKNT